jgi:hypothetical protein
VIRKGYLFTLLFSLLAPVANGATIYVDKDNSCPGSGTTGSPYCSIQNAFDAVAAGDTIRIRDAASAYDQAAILQTSGTSGSRITIEPDTGHNPTIYRASGSVEAAIELRKVSYVTIQNLNFDATGINTPSYGVWLHASITLEDGTDMLENRILNNTFKNWGGDSTRASSAKARGALNLDGAIRLCREIFSTVTAKLAFLFYTPTTRSLRAMSLSGPGAVRIRTQR